MILASLVLTANTVPAAAAGAHNVVWPDVDASNVTAFAAPHDHNPVSLFGFEFAGPGHGTVYAASSSRDYDTSAVIDNSADVAAQQVTDAANQQMMLNSMQAAQEQNDEANAEVTAGILAAQQTEINANNQANMNN
ncbi:MAG TPA: hypothetical protein VGG11_03785 [Xanthobacteraceae bacterium]